MGGEWVKNHHATDASGQATSVEVGMRREEGTYFFLTFTAHRHPMTLDVEIR